MATGLYDKGRNHFAMGDLHWKATGGDNFMITLIDANDYVADLANHEFMNTDTVPLAARIATQPLVPADPVAGVCDAADVVFPTVSGDVAEALMIWKDGGGSGNSASGTTDLLVAYIDNYTGLPVTPNGGNINLAFDDGANKIFKL